MELLANSEDNWKTILHRLKLKSSLTCLISCWPLKAGEENPVVHLSVVSLNGPLHTVVMKKPDDPRIGWVTAQRWMIVYQVTSNKNSPLKIKKNSISLSVLGDRLTVVYSNLLVFQEGVLYHHGEMGHQHQTGCQLAEQSPEQLYTDTVWGYNWSLR